MGIYDGFDIKSTAESSDENSTSIGSNSTSYVGNSYQGPGNDSSGDYNRNKNGGDYKRNSSGEGSWKGNKKWASKDPDVDPSKVFLYRPYVITGDRSTPPEVTSRLVAVMKQLEEKHFTTRSSGLDGPDATIIKDSANLELFLPWKPFNGLESKNYFNTKECLVIAKQFHPAFDGLKPAIHAFLGCNVRLILGNNLKSAARFMLCYTEDGAESDKTKSSKTGNLGLAISIASAMRVPVFNFRHTDAEQRLFTFLS